MLEGLTINFGLVASENTVEGISFVTSEVRSETGVVI